MHLKSADKNLRRELNASQKNYLRERRREERHQERGSSSAAPEEADMHSLQESSHH